MAAFHIFFGGLSARRFLDHGADPWGEVRNPSKTTLVDEFKCIADMLEATPHTLVFIITKAQWEQWQSISTKYGWSKYIHYEMPYFVSNRNYPMEMYNSPLGKKPTYNESTRKLRLVILKGTGTDET